MPRLYITPSMQPNAFATGRNPENAAVAVTKGLLQVLNRSELEGVLAHELAHVKNRDVLLATVAATFAYAIAMIANIIKWGAILGGDEMTVKGAATLSVLLPWPSSPLWRP